MELSDENLSGGTFDSINNIPVFNSTIINPMDMRCTFEFDDSGILKTQLSHIEKNKMHFFLNKNNDTGEIMPLEKVLKLLKKDEICDVSIYYLDYSGSKPSISFSYILRKFKFTQINNLFDSIDPHGGQSVDMPNKILEVEFDFDCVYFVKHDIISQRVNKLKQVFGEDGDAWFKIDKDKIKF